MAEHRARLRRRPSDRRATLTGRQGQLHPPGHRGVPLISSHTRTHCTGSSTMAAAGSSAKAALSPVFAALQQRNLAALRALLAGPEGGQATREVLPGEVVAMLAAAPRQRTAATPPPPHTFQLATGVAQPFGASNPTHPGPCYRRHHAAPCCRDAWSGGRRAAAGAGGRSCGLPSPGEPSWKGLVFGLDPNMFESCRAPAAEILSSCTARPCRWRAVRGPVLRQLFNAGCMFGAVCCNPGDPMPSSIPNLVSS